MPLGRMKFIDETSTLSAGPGLTPPLSDTWSSVIEHQVDTIRKANGGNNEVPVWAVAEAEEVGTAARGDVSRDIRLTLSSPPGLKLYNSYKRRWLMSYLFQLLGKILC
jgi:hypothetical protein